MRLYSKLLDDGETIVYLGHIGCNHNAIGLSFGGMISSYPEAFDEEDEVTLESGLDDMRHCTIGNVKEAYEILKKILQKRKPSNLEEYSLCVQETILKYFGDYSNIKERLSFYPTDDDIDDEIKMGKVSDLAHKNAAMCVERAMLSQNLLKLLGIDSIYKMSGMIVNGKPDAHAYNLIHDNDKYYLFDATIPTLKNDEISPLIAEIPKDVYDKILKMNKLKIVI